MIVGLIDVILEPAVHNVVYRDISEKCCANKNIQMNSQHVTVDALLVRARCQIRTGAMQR